MTFAFADAHTIHRIFMRSGVLTRNVGNPRRNRHRPKGESFRNTLRRISAGRRAGGHIRHAGQNDATYGLVRVTFQITPVLVGNSYGVPGLAGLMRAMPKSTMYSAPSGPNLT